MYPNQNQKQDLRQNMYHKGYGRIAFLELQPTVLPVHWNQ